MLHGAVVMCMCIAAPVPCAAHGVGAELVLPVGTEVHKQPPLLADCALGCCHSSGSVTESWCYQPPHMPFTCALSSVCAVHAPAASWVPAATAAAAHAAAAAAHVPVCCPACSVASVMCSRQVPVPPRAEVSNGAAGCAVRKSL